jgi:uncharacterized membrane protein required for colicin V production
MIPFLVCFGAFVVVFLFAQNGTKTGGFPALCGLLGSLFALFAALRYWFLLSRWLSDRENMPIPILAIITFWSVFIVSAFIFAKVRQQLAIAYQSVIPSFIDRVLGAAFGTGAGLAVVSAMMMSLSILSPAFWPAYKADQLPLPVDRWLVDSYHFIESRCAGIPSTDKSHTPLPPLNGKYAENPVDFWK